NAELNAIDSPSPEIKSTNPAASPTSTTRSPLRRVAACAIGPAPLTVEIVVAFPSRARRAGSHHCFALLVHVDFDKIGPGANFVMLTQREPAPRVWRRFETRCFS